MKEDYKIDIPALEAWLDSNPFWFSGPPPSIGWWPSSIFKEREVLRWWDGSHWSYPVDYATPIWEVVLCSGIYSTAQSEIRWTHRPKNWPARSYT